jgi:hypothetical protein
MGFTLSVETRARLRPTLYAGRLYRREAILG